MRGGGDGGGVARKAGQESLARQGTRGTRGGELELGLQIATAAVRGGTGDAGGGGCGLAGGVEYGWAAYQAGAERDEGGLAPVGDANDVRACHGPVGSDPNGCTL